MCVGGGGGVECPMLPVVFKKRKKEPCCMSLSLRIADV